MWSWFQREIVDNGRLPLFACFAAFVITFLTTRTITRLIRAGRGPFKDHVSASGTHVHHAVPGIILLTAGAFAALAFDVDATWSVVAGLLVGTGTSLVLDEFALILHLSDVYWQQEGQLSVQMVSLGAACLGLLLLGVDPFKYEDGGGTLSVIGTVAIVGSHVLLIAVCVAKGKYPTALLGAFVPFVAGFGALRLARPTSRWAKRWYRPKKLARATARMAHQDERWGPVAHRVADLVAGTPTQQAS